MLLLVSALFVQVFSVAVCEVFFCNVGKSVSDSSAALFGKVGV